MTYSVIISKIAEKQLRALDTEARSRILLKLKEAAEDPFLYAERLKGSHLLYKLRVGKYRVIIQILRDKCLIIVLKTKKRSKAYGGT